jgi:hypothetical protein
MSGLQKLVLIMLAGLVASVFCVVVFLARSVLLSPTTVAVARETPTPSVPGEPTLVPTLTLVPTWTPLPEAQETLQPTATATRVVLDTTTPTATPIVTTTPLRPPTATPDSGASSAIGGTVKSPARKTTPTATPQPSYPFKLSASQVYTTANSFFVMYAQIKNGGTLLGGFRIVGTHQPSGMSFESAPSCYDMCKASGPRASTTACCNTQCTPEANSLPANVQEGNVAFETPLYETGAYYIKLVDAQGKQVSDVIEIPIDGSDRKWFFYVFSLN